VTNSANNTLTEIDFRRDKQHQVLKLDQAAGVRLGFVIRAVIVSFRSATSAISTLSLSFAL
jgi:hypothetical protein